MWIKTIIFVQILVFGIASATTDKLVCYFGSWSVYRPGNGRFDVDNIDPFLCTHLVYAFVGIARDGSFRILDSYNDVDRGAFRRFNNLTNINTKLKTLVGIGGWNEGSETFSYVARNPQLRSTFVKNAVNFLKTYAFQGLDLDWEYPGRRGGVPEDKSAFSDLLKELRAVFDREGLLLTAAVSATPSSVAESYEVPELARYLDFINVMTYDLHGVWDGRTGHHSPLYPSSLDTTPEAKELNVATCIQGWISKGAAPEKLILGMGTYGRTYTLLNNTNSGMYARISGPGSAGPYTRQTGVLGYNEIVENFQANQWNIVWDNEIEAPYTYRSSQWIGYDNPESIRRKVEYLKNLKLGGAMIWSIETDDFRGVSGSKYPLLTTIKLTLNGEFPSEPSTNRPPNSTSLTTTTAPPNLSTSTTTNDPPVTFKCSKAGYFKDPLDCSKFYNCMPYNGGFLQYDFCCPGGLVFNEEKQMCDYKENYEC